jgi:hypothetical protein
MSGSRAILLRLSVQDADVVRQQLVSMGAAGETALARLDAAAQKAAGTPGTASRGGGGGGGTGMGAFNARVQQGGYQLQDFVVQVQGGTSALTALSQQGSQFLGVFGPAGAIAGAALTVGLLAAQLVGVGDSGDKAGKAIEDAFKAAAQQFERLRDLAREVDDFMLSADDRARQAAARTRTSLLERGQTELRTLSNQQEVASADMLKAAQDFNRIQAQRARLEIELRDASPRARAGIESDLREAQGSEFDARARMQGAQREAERISAAIADLRAQETRLRTQLSAAEQEEANRYGPQPPNRAVNPPATRAGKFDAGQTRRDMTVSLSEDAVAWDRYARSVNLANAGLERGAGIIAQYERDQTTLREARERGIITEAEFGAEVERTSVRLAEQLDEIQNRASGTNDVSRQLGLTFSSAFEDAISKGKSFREVLSGIASDLAKLVIRKGITDPLFNAVSPVLSSATSGIGEWLASFIPGRAVGGPVSAGMPYMVGERGPELFVPNASGTIVPNGAGGATFAPTYNIDARGADASMLPRLRAEMQAIAQASLAGFADLINRGGSAARVVGRR